MPLETSVINEVLEYCKRDLPHNYDWFENEFDFIEDAELKEHLSKAFYSSRYIYKLMEALFISGNELHAHLKFQIMQYASIYEAVINYLLLNRYKQHPSVVSMQLHKSYRPVSALSSMTKVFYEDEEAIICVYKDTKTPWTSIPFDQKVDTAVDIGLFDENVGEEIKGFYKLRNAVHIEAAAKRGIDYEIEEAKLAYRRMRPFIDQIKDKISRELVELA